jgi:hypothetical protein
VLERNAARELLLQFERLLAEDDVLHAAIRPEEHHLARRVVDTDTLEYVA